MQQSSLSPKEFQEKLSTQEYILIDVRTPGEFSQGHIPGAQLIDVYASNFMEQIQKLDKQKKYLIYCRSGARTHAVLGMMAQMGFSEAHDLHGGIMAL